MNRCARCFLLLAAWLWLGCFPALAIRSYPLETRVGGWEPLASGQTSTASVQSPGNAMGFAWWCYESASGRFKWLNRDPIQERGGLNLYRAMKNNPLRFIDPKGLEDDDGDADEEADQQAMYRLFGVKPPARFGDPDDNSEAADTPSTPPTPEQIQQAANQAGQDILAEQDILNGVKNPNQSPSAEPCPTARMAPGAGYPSKSMGGTVYTGGYDPAQRTVYLGDSGHPQGVYAAGGDPNAPGITGITVVQTPSGVTWAADSPSLPPNGFTPAQADNVQTALQNQFPGLPVTQVQTIR